MDDQIPAASETLDSETTGSITLRRLIFMGIIVRLFVDTCVQIFSPFLSAIAAGLGMSIVSLGALNSLRSLMGLAAPGFGSLTNRFGYRRVMRLQLLLGAAGMFIFSVSRNRLMLVVAMVIMGLGVFSFASILQAYMSAFIPYRRRAQGLGLVELSWAFASIVGLSLSGVLIQRFDWRAPFWFLGTGLLVAFYIFGKLPKTERNAIGAKQPAKIPNLYQLVQQLRELVAFESNTSSAWGAIVASGLIMFGVVNLASIYGTWLVEEYALNTAEIGLVALVLGVADLAAISVTSMFGDRIGIRRFVLICVSSSVIAYLLLPFLNIALYPVIGAIILTRFTFEAGFVANISLLSEQIPSQRAKVLTVSSAVVTVGVALGSVVGPAVYSTWNATAIGFISAGAVFPALIILLRRVQEGDA